MLSLLLNLLLFLPIWISAVALVCDGVNQSRKRKRPVFFAEDARFAGDKLQYRS